MKNLSVQYRKQMVDLESKAMKEERKRQQQASFERQQSDAMKHELIQKKIQYSKKVLEFHKPAVSERIRSEVDSKKAEFFNSRTTWHQGKDSLSRRESQCGTTMHNPRSEKSPRTSPETIRSNMRFQYVDFKRMKNPMVPSKQPRKDFEKIDYLSEQRQRKTLNHTAEPQNGYNPVDWTKKILKTKDSKSKYETLLQEADKLER